MVAPASKRNTPVRASENTQMLHVRLEGRSFDVRFTDLDIGANTPERDVKSRLAAFLDIAGATLKDSVLDRHPNGNLTLRPHAVYG